MLHVHTPVSRLLCPGQDSVVCALQDQSDCPRGLTCQIDSNFRPSHRAAVLLLFLSLSRLCFFRVFAHMYTYLRILILQHWANSGHNSSRWVVNAVGPINQAVQPKAQPGFFRYLPKSHHLPHPCTYKYVPYVRQHNNVSFSLFPFGHRPLHPSFATHVFACLFFSPAVFSRGRFYLVPRPALDIEFHRPGATSARHLSASATHMQIPRLPRKLGGPAPRVPAAGRGEAGRGSGTERPSCGTAPPAAT